MADDEKDIINLSSSSSSSYDDDEDNNESDDAGSLSDWSEEDVGESEDDYNYDDDDHDNHGDDDAESLVTKVIHLLKEGRDLKDLKLKECKAYLRKHGLRLTGTKVVCVERIVEHWRIKDGNGEAVYPGSSFVINCRGDVCRGDVVLFTHKVYQKFDKMKRHGKLLGTRTVAGKVVKESYGAAKQQHTFTVEVLWSKGIQRLPPLHPLLVKGRNLYRLKTFRQPWDNEADRLKVLSEKHNRGAAARKVRGMRKERKMQSGNMGRGERNEKRQKDVCDKKPLQIRKTTEAGKGKHVQREYGKALSDQTRNRSVTSRLCVHPDQNPSMGNQNSAYHKKETCKAAHSCAPRSYPPHSYAPRPYTPYSHASHSNASQSHTLDSYPPHSFARHSYAPCSYGYPVQNPGGSRNQFNHTTVPFDDLGSIPNTMGSTSFKSNVETTMPFSHCERSYSESNPSYSYEARDLDCFSGPTISHRQGREAHKQGKDRFRPNYR